MPPGLVDESSLVIAAAVPSFRWDERISRLKVGSFPSEGHTWPAANHETGEVRQHFTSGLWSLFHILSVSQAPKKKEPYVIMEGIHTFVDNFFRCLD